MKVTYIGHATLLVEIGTVRLLTDPNFDQKLGGFLPRVSPPGIAIDRLPQLDALLLTHAHADHLSFASLDALPRDIPLYAPPVIAKWLRRRGYSHAEDLGPGGTVSIGVVMQDDGALDLPGLLAQADQALYCAKARGRNRVVVIGLDLFLEGGEAPPAPATVPSIAAAAAA